MAGARPTLALLLLAPCEILLQRPGQAATAPRASFALGFLHAGLTFADPSRIITRQGLGAPLDLITVLRA
jgi:hypothetical protein